MLDRAEELRRALPGAEGEDPGDRHAGERTGSARSAAAVPLSAHCRSSSEIRSGPSSAARSSIACRSCSSQYRCSGSGVKLPQPGSLEQRVAPSNSAVISGASSTTPAPGSAAPTPTRNASRRATRRRLGEQAGLAHARLSLDEYHRAGAGADAVELNADRREFSVPTANNAEWERSPGPDQRVYVGRDCIDGP